MCANNFEGVPKMCINLRRTGQKREMPRLRSNQGHGLLWRSRNGELKTLTTITLKRQVASSPFCGIAKVLLTLPSSFQGKLWEVRSSNGKWLAVFARRKIKRGTRIIIEPPLFNVR